MITSGNMSMLRETVKLGCQIVQLMPEARHAQVCKIRLPGCLEHSVGSLLAALLARPAQYPACLSDKREAWCEVKISKARSHAQVHFLHNDRGPHLENDSESGEELSELWMQPYAWDLQRSRFQSQLSDRCDRCACGREIPSTNRAGSPDSLFARFFTHVMQAAADTRAMLHLWSTPIVQGAVLNGLLQVCHLLGGLLSWHQFAAVSRASDSSSVQHAIFCL